MRKLFSILLIGIVLSSFSLSPVSAAKYSSTFSLSQTPSVGEPLVTFHGVIKPALRNAPVSIFVKLNDAWVDTRLKGVTTSSGAWKIEAVATALEAKVSYRALVMIGKTKVYSPSKSITIKQQPSLSVANESELIALLGPGGRIHGMDISRWQHPNDATIDFVKAYSSGIRFVLIKASDSRDDADVLAKKYVVMDRNAAQAAGIYTGFYHYAVLPNTSDRAAIITDATTEAQKAVWRLTSLGGFNTRDLTYALDLENNCIKISRGVCTKYATRSSVTLWAETWMSVFYSKTGRKPFLYSYPSFLEGAMNRSDVLRDFPLWLSQFAINPADPIAEPGRKVSGCFVHSWSTANCTSLWQIWQYTSCGIAPKYGVPGSRVDLNIYRGDPANFLKLVAGEWVPQVGDQLPINESTSLMITSIKATDTNASVEIGAQVIRITGT
ncbi:MAG: lysozyme M1 (1,4-beta-N-acetylmuramidase), partial [Actinobacteria bacterium]|nr:lysozyme M1 (1,4-beta-N-acetylmuramidase) [Actinomycetota bacterium]